MRPVSAEHRTSQAFGSGATAGIAPNSNPDSGWAYYVHLYGNYQPYGHAGLDIACPVGTPIYAPAAGTVIYSGWSEDLPGTGNIRKWLFYYNFGGILTLIQHNGWISVIAHQSSNDAVHVGMKVAEGQVIGKSGDTKTRTTKVAPHVHVEALVDLSYKTGGGLIYGRANPELFFGSAAIAPQGNITPQPVQEDDEMTPQQMQEIKDFVYSTVGTMLTQYHDVTRANVIGELSKKIEDSAYEVKVFTHSVDNSNADRVINDNRAQHQTP